jgi:hypothetical protein
MKQLSIYAYYTSRDSWVQFTSTPCGTNQIKGNIFIDKNTNCIYDADTNYTSSTLVKASGNKDFIVTTDENGDYILITNRNPKNSV